MPPAGQEAQFSARAQARASVFSFRAVIEERSRTQHGQRKQQSQKGSEETQKGEAEASADSPRELRVATRSAEAVGASRVLILVDESNVVSSVRAVDRKLDWLKLRDLLTNAESG